MLTDGAQRRPLASTSERGNENIRSSRNRTLKLSSIQSHACAPTPRLASTTQTKLMNSKTIAFLSLIQLRIIHQNRFTGLTAKREKRTDGKI